MIRFFFLQDGQTKFVEISHATDERLKSHRQKNKVTVQQIAEQIRGQYGVVSENFIIQYLNSKASPR